MAPRLSSLLAGCALLTMSGFYFSIQGDQWCFHNPDSINGPFVTARHWSLGGHGLAYITSSDLQEPGWQCSTLAVGTEALIFKGPATCRSLIPISVHNYWNTVTIQASSITESGSNCSSCLYSDVPVGGPWPQIPCSELPPHRPSQDPTISDQLHIS
ncbi:unnamed protein product [Symbiodinium pilosum]|uniref:Uncharacterized protein n=1 Tax=Symbiodinium pilosum TaxID=2952 RepID=A0A812RZB9_SYMPI|nr:unnamed protein product [Symbiodinium pilosum]